MQWIPTFATVNDPFFHNLKTNIMLCIYVLYSPLCSRDVKLPNQSIYYAEIIKSALTIRPANSAKCYKESLRPVKFPDIKNIFTSV